MQTFPVMQPLRRNEPRYDGPDVPWALVLRHEAQALKNHSGQSLTRLAERGGLCPSELVAVLQDRPWRSMDPEGANATLAALVKQWKG